MEASRLPLEKAISSYSDINELIKLSYEAFLPIVMRGALAEDRSQHGWLEYLSSLPFLEIDTRQFDATTKDFFRSSWWEITNIVSKSKAYAHSTGPQPLHTDNAWFADPADINIFLMKKQAPHGGSQIVYPLNSLIEDLKSSEKYLYERLLTTKVLIKKGDTSYSNLTTILTKDKRGNPLIHWNYNRVIRSSPEIEKLVEEFAEFLNCQVSNKSSSIIEIYLNSGDGLIMNDGKNLHGRNSFTAFADNERVLLQSMWRYRP